MARRKYNRFSGTTTSLVPTQASLEAHRPRTRAEAQTIAESRKLGLVLTAESVRVQYANVKMREIFEQLMTTYAQTVEDIEEARASSGLRPEVQAFVDEFAEHLMERSGRLYLGVVETAVHNIGMHVDRSLYFEDQVVIEERRGFWRRLFGG